MSRPERSYRAFYSAAGNRFEMQFNVDQRTLQKLMAAGAIDEAEILGLAREHQMPDMAADVRELTWAANAMRVTQAADDVLGEVAAFAKEHKAIVGRLAGKIAALRDDLDKLVDADPTGEQLIRFQGDGGPGVIEIDTVLLAGFRAEADRTAQYLRDWWRARVRGFTAITQHGDIMALAQIVERAAHRAGTTPGFANATGSGVKFIEAILIRAAVVSNGEMICQAIKRHRAKVKKLQNSQPH
jgi:hypothetical protein